MACFDMNFCAHVFVLHFLRARGRGEGGREMEQRQKERGREREKERKREGREGGREGGRTGGRERRSGPAFDHGQKWGHQYMDRQDTVQEHTQTQVCIPPLRRLDRRLAARFLRIRPPLSAAAVRTRTHPPALHCSRLPSRTESGSSRRSHSIFGFSAFVFF